MTARERLLGDVSGEFVDGPFGSNLKASEYVDQGVPIIRLQNIRPNRFLEKDIKFVSAAKAADLRRHSYRAGDVVIAKLGDVGTACVVPPSCQDGLIVADVIRFRSDESEVDHRYLSHFLNSTEGKRRVLGLSKGSTRVRTNLSDLRKISIPLPSVAEQRRIAAILDKADALRAKRREAIAKLDRLLQSVFLDMFGDPATNPKSLPVKPLGELATEIYRYPTYYDIEYHVDGVPEVRGEMILSNGTIDLLKARYISQTTSNRFPRTQLAEGDLVMSVRGTIGKVGLVTGDLKGANMTANLIRISPDKAQLNPSYLWRYAMSAFFVDYVDRVSASTTIKTIKAPDLRALPVIVPAMAEQNRFAYAQRKLLRASEAALKSEQKLGQMFSALQTKAFSGGL